MLIALVLGVLLSFQGVNYSDGFYNRNEEADYRYAKSLYEFKLKTIKGEEVSMEKYRGYVLIVVNVASKCDYAERSYKELVELYEKYRSRGLRILAFPCNDYMHQEPGDNATIALFAKNRNVTFDLFEKTIVIGQNSTNFFKYLIYKKPGPHMHVIKWNFTKFIIDRNGVPVERYDCDTFPLSMEEDLEKYLRMPVPPPPPSTTPRNETVDYNYGFDDDD